MVFADFRHKNAVFADFCEKTGYLPIFRVKNRGSRMINRLKHVRVDSSPRCRTRGDIVPGPPFTYYTFE